MRENIGEARLSGENCTFADGPFAGRTLRDVWPGMPPEWKGTELVSEKAFPLLVKFLFTEDKPSVQVHPHDDYAARFERDKGGRGKTEMWYAVAARPGAEVLVGLKPGVTRDSFRRSILDGTAERNLERIPVQDGDAVFVPAGTAHTIGGGLVLCEIQQNSDITYRVYDYDRRDTDGKGRPLHIEKAMDVIQFGEQGGGKLEPVSIERGPVTQTYFIACRYFATEKWDFERRISADTSGEHFDLLIAIGGHGRFEWPGNSADYAPAQLWLIPAALGAYQIIPDSRTSLIHTYVPSNFDEFVRRLSEHGVAEADWSRLIYP